MKSKERNVVVLIPCYNESITISKVISDFQMQLPDAVIYVYDNNSTDDSVKKAATSNATICHEYQQGKGSVIRSMFRDIDADIYVMVDADDTYPANAVHDMMTKLEDDGADMVIGDRLSKGIYSVENKRIFHDFGNNLVKWLINTLFRSNINDIMTGYRIFSKRFVKNTPIMSKGFEVETEMTLHALDKNFTISEVPIDYQDRPLGSESKLNTIQDGFRVLRTILLLFKDYKPLVFFSFFSILFFLLGLAAGIPVIVEYIESGYVYKIPSAILSIGLMIISALSLFTGFILDTIVRQNKSNFELNMYK